MSNAADTAGESGAGFARADHRAPRRVFRLIYKSHSRIEPEQSQSDLGAIFATARRNNRRADLTGALMITEDAFVQTLEGDESVVRDLFERIGQDERHDRVTVVEEQTVPGRTFGHWAMAKMAKDGGPDIHLLSRGHSGGKIVSAGADQHITPEQETVLAFMRGSVADDAVTQ